jgi:hypothetical protein
MATGFLLGGVEFGPRHGPIDDLLAPEAGDAGLPLNRRG